jgi:hypothetical protein
LELRGLVGGWFGWHPGDLDPVLLLGGGSGVCRCWRWSALLVDQGDAPAPIKTERFGPSGA